MKKVLLKKQKASFIIFKVLQVAWNYLRPESEHLNVNGTYEYCKTY